MSKSNSYETAYLQLLYQNANIANIGDATGLRGSSAAGSLYFAGHTADPGEAGDQTTSEATTACPTRKAVARNSTEFPTANPMQNANAQTFAANGGAAQDVLFWSIGVAASGASQILNRGHFGSLAKGFTGATNDDVKCPGHGLAVNDRVVFYSRPGMTLPTGITEGTVYFVKTAADADTFTISTTQGGATVDITAVGSGVAGKVTPVTVNPGNSLVIPALGMSHYED